MPEGGEVTQKIAEYEAAGWQFPDGLTPPMKNVRIRRFRHTNSYARQKDVEAIEKRVQELLEKDENATASTFTVYDSTGKAVLVGGGRDGKFVKPEQNLEDYDQLMNGEEEFDGVQEAMMEESSGDDDDGFAAELEEEMLADEAMVEPTVSSGMGEEKSPTSSVSPAVMELQARINERKAQLASVSNPLIKARLEDVIKQLESDLHSRIP